MIHTLLSLSRPLFVIDTETTGINPKTDRIIELGFQRWETSGMTKEWRTLVNPRVSIPASTSKVHGIYDADVAEAINFSQLAANLAKGFADCDFAGKNVRFDLRIVAAEMQRAGVEWSYSDARIIDIDRLEQLAVPRDLESMHAKYVKTMCVSCGGKGWREATDGAKCGECRGDGTVSLPHDGAHGALSDVRASMAVICAQLEAHAVLPRDLNLLHALQWPGMIDMDGKFRFVEGVPCFTQWGKYASKPMKAADVGYWDFILKSDFSSEVKALASAAKLGKFPER